MEMVIDLRAGVLLALALTTACGADDPGHEDATGPVPVGAVPDRTTDAGFAGVDGAPGFAADRVDLDGDGFAAGVDCDDGDPARHPGADEICDGLDQDCDGLVDEGVEQSFYVDWDRDGFGDAEARVSACEAGPGMAEVAGDCAPLDPDITVRTWGYDHDGDGHAGDLEPLASQCEPPGADWVEDLGDCDDFDADISPEAVEIEGDGVDDDCSGEPDPVRLDIAGLTEAACPAHFPADDVGLEIVLKGQDATGRIEEMRIRYAGADVVDDVDVWLVEQQLTRVHQVGSPVGGTTRTWGVTCEEDGVHFAFEAVGPTGGAAPDRTVFRSRPLVLPASLVDTPGWVVEGLQIEPAPGRPSRSDASAQQAFVVGEWLEVPVADASYDAVDVWFDAPGDQRALMLLADGLGPVAFGVDGPGMVFQAGRVERN